MTPLSLAPSSTERDDNGRLVHLTFESTPPINTNEGWNWLVAIDGSGHALKALTHVAGMKGAVHLINVQGYLSKEAAETELAQQGLKATHTARTWLDSKNIAWKLHVFMGDPADTLLSASQALKVSGIIMGSRGHNSAIGQVLFGSVAYKVMHQSPLPITVVR